MIEPPARRRQEVLTELLALRGPIDPLVHDVRRLPWDSDAELVILSRAAVATALRRYLAGDLSDRDLENWADAIESREDIGLEAGHEELLSSFVSETANPSLAEPLTDRRATIWLERLTKP